MAQNILVIACGGGLGAALRFLVSFYANEHGGLLFPYGTAIVNIAGSFMIGLCAAYFSVHADLPPAIRLFPVTAKSLIAAGNKTLCRYGNPRGIYDLFHLQPRAFNAYSYGPPLLCLSVRFAQCRSCFHLLFYRSHCGRILFLVFLKDFSD